MTDNILLEPGGRRRKLQLSFDANVGIEEGEMPAVEMHYSGRRFLVAFGSALAALGAILVALYMGGVALAVPLGVFAYRRTG